MLLIEISKDRYDFPGYENVKDNWQYLITQFKDPESKTKFYIHNAKQIHGDKYTYDHTKYVAADKPITVTCPKHGDFKVRAVAHVSPYHRTGCQECSGRKRLSTQEWIVKAAKKHDNFYSYDKTKYTGTSKKVTVTCPKHGDFSVFPRNHIKGIICAKCAGQGLTNDEWIEQSKERYGNQFTYELTEYTKGNNPITITCTDHGQINLKQAKTHFKNTYGGCRQCGRDARKAANNT